MWQISCAVWSVAILSPADMMKEITQAIREKAKSLLTTGQVEAVLGFRRGTLPMARRPFLATSPEQAEKLCWDDFCLMNLANFLPPGNRERIAVIAKGCDWRNLVVHESENQIDLKNGIEILGVPCSGMLDPEKIYQAVGGAEQVTEVTCSNEKVQVKLINGDEFELEMNSLYRQACCECRHPAPEPSTWVCDPIDNRCEPKSAGSQDALEASEKPGNIKQLQDTFRDCLMCFACRDACPLCYCHHCFVDTEKSHWIAKTPALGGLLDFHFFRAHHIAGRCTACGACESACPMNIPVRRLVKKLNHRLEESTGYVPGITSNVQRPVDIFRPAYHETQKSR